MRNKKVGSESLDLIGDHRDMTNFRLLNVDLGSI